MTHPILTAAAAGALPAWAEASPARHAHLDRVADLMETWARAFGLEPGDIVRWRAAAMLHDALRDADPRTLRPRVEPEVVGAPGALLHGPAAAARLREEGVGDEPLLRAVAWHTLGHPRLDRLGHALYVADYVEPGRTHAPERAAGWRERAPAELPAVVREIAAERIGYALLQGHPLLEPTVRFWNGLLDG